MNEGFFRIISVLLLQELVDASWISFRGKYSLLRTFGLKKIVQAKKTVISQVFIAD
ncbi:hypothetical protein A21D_03322 [Virgibacillus dokdonensis]|uniref:Uncharacterized protein n=1 Tax=Virgibacillus dokdonensis TaxID=302167 RepID=A0A2K9J3B6_9BACI|nr:hypothetical protein [Virgibacillus dokdonensis]AUJ26356.1 hypothetical protein A21D_03322 [Virgibacillus dokdonensis]